MSWREMESGVRSVRSTRMYSTQHKSEKLKNMQKIVNFFDGIWIF